MCYFLAASAAAPILESWNRSPTKGEHPCFRTLVGCVGECGGVEVKMVGTTGFEPATSAPRDLAQPIFIGLRRNFLADLHPDFTACVADILFFHPKTLSVAEVPDRMLCGIAQATQGWIEC